jgi:hypothetical protein
LDRQIVNIRDVFTGEIAEGITAVRNLTVSLLGLLFSLSLLTGCGAQTAAGTAIPGAGPSSIAATKVKPNVLFSTTISVNNEYSREISNWDFTTAGTCWTTPSSFPNVLAGSASSPFTISYQSTCVGDQLSYSILYGPDAAHVDLCSLVVTAHPDTQTFTYAIHHDSTTYTTCSYNPELDGTISFNYDMTLPARHRRI